MTEMCKPKKKICLIIPYFGKLPNYFDLWLESVRHNLDYNFLIITDAEIENNLPENVRVIKSSFEDLVKKIQSLYPFKISLNSPYKLCDYRPAYGEIFIEELVEYDFWGYCDVDLIFGSINHFIKDDDLEKNEKINLHGHFSLYKNNEKMNTLYKTKRKELVDYKTVFKSKWNYHFDEYPGIAFICKYESIETVDCEDYADINWLDKRFIKKYDHTQKKNDNDDIEQIFKWDKGTLYNLIKRENKVEYQECMYVHLQKRNMIDNVEKANDSFYIIPNQFIKNENQDELNLINNSIPEKDEELIKQFKKECRRNRLKWSYWKKKIIMSNKVWQ